MLRPILLDPNKAGKPAEDLQNNFSVCAWLTIDDNQRITHLKAFHALCIPVISEFLKIGCWIQHRAKLI
jgi:hypothetical protein